MKKEFTYSFIIPHHNTPNLLNRLLDSIPMREDIEIIVVDDNSDVGKKASTDRRDVKIVYVDKDNSNGAGKARNIGMASAAGKWLLFADSDDFYKDGFLQILDDYKDDDIDILFFNIDSVDSDTLAPIERGRLQKRLIEEYDGSEEASNNLLYLTFSPWRRMLRHDYVKKYHLQFEETLRGNDMFFSLQASYFAKNWKVDTREVYTLTHYSGSLTYGTQTKTKYKPLLLIYRRTAEFYKFIGHPEWNKRTLRGVYPQSCLRQIVRFFKIKKSTGVEAFFYYITHWLYIERNASYYVDVVKELKRNANVCN